MSTEFLLAKAAEKDSRILELEMRLHEVVQREQSLLKQLETLYNEKTKEREEKQILQCRVASLEAELSEYIDGSGLKYVTQDEVTSLCQGIVTPISSPTEEESKTNFKHSNQWPRRLSVDEDKDSMYTWSPNRNIWSVTCDD